MDMNREAYKLANKIRTNVLAENNRIMESPRDDEMERYQKYALQEIEKEKRRYKRRFGKMSIAACAAVALLTGTLMFRGEVHAAIQQITWSIESALGLSGDLAEYRDVLHTSVEDRGYVITLQEAVVSEERLTINYTLQREDGQPMDQYLIPDETLYVNGSRAVGGGGGSAGFLDEDQIVLGIEMSYDIPGVDLSKETEFRIEIHELGFGEGLRGNWEFAFTADGFALIADTRRITIGRTFTLPDGVSITLEELTMNELEQRISFTQSGPTRYLPLLWAEDSEGHQVEFGLRSCDEKSGYLSNEEIIDDGRIADTASQVMFTFFVDVLPEEDGQIIEDNLQVGETFKLELN